MSPGCAARLSGLLSGGAMQALQSAVAGWITAPCDDVLARASLVTNRKAFPFRNYLAAVGASPHEGMLRLFAGGGTIVFDDVAPVAPVFQRAHDELLAAGFQVEGVNVYVSASCESGLGWHTDPHDVLAVQLFGAKHWNVPPDCIVPAVRGAAPPETSQLLTAGEALLLTAGTPHSTSTPPQGTSVHATFNLGLSVPRRAAVSA